MSALPVIEPVVEPSPISRPLPRLPAPIIIELPRTKIQRQPVRRVKAQRRVSALVGQTVSFVVVAGIAFSTFSLMGQVMVEKARRDGIRASERALSASRDIAALRQDVQDLSSSQSIDDWATSNGFVPTDSAPKTPGVTQIVALNR